MYWIFTGLIILGLLIMIEVVTLFSKAKWMDDQWLDDRRLKLNELTIKDWVSFLVMTLGSLAFVFGVVGFFLYPKIQADAQRHIYRTRIEKLKPQIKQMQFELGVDKVQAYHAKDNASIRYYVHKQVNDKDKLTQLKHRLADYEAKVR